MGSSRQACQATCRGRKKNLRPLDSQSATAQQPWIPFELFLEVFSSTSSIVSIPRSEGVHPFRSSEAQSDDLLLYYQGVGRALFGPRSATSLLIVVKLTQGLQLSNMERSASIDKDGSWGGAQHASARKTGAALRNVQARLYITSTDCVSIITSA